MSFMREFICYQEPMGPSFDLALTLLGWAWIRDSKSLVEIFVNSNFLA